MPNRPLTKTTTFRIHKPLIRIAAAKAAAEGRGLAEVVRSLIANWAGLPPEAAQLSWHRDDEPELRAAAENLEDKQS